ncbi:hypothetical protein O3M35_004235 [Rhynocoris fuscipes]|uniref:Uncharacterized protein n=1 Tax=Rhynocoris fuscipes TaxID=488301 RepID=A0AAW1CM11_9HEMI
MVILLINYTFGQLTFTPGWGSGKRSLIHNSALECNYDPDSFIVIYKYLQVSTIEKNVQYFSLKN